MTLDNNLVQEVDRIVKKLKKNRSADEFSVWETEQAWGDE